MLNFILNLISDIRIKISLVIFVLLTFIVCEFIIYEFRLKYAEIYKNSLSKTWKDMKEALEVVIGLLKYEVYMNYNL